MIKTVIATDEFFYLIRTRIMDSFSCSPLNTCSSSYIRKKHKNILPENPEYAEMQHGDIILTLQ